MRLSATEAENMASWSSGHREDVEKGETVGCYFCVEWYPTAEIVEWIDDGKTAVCPRCGVDAVLPGIACAFESDVLGDMFTHWFGEVADMCGPIGSPPANAT